MISAYTLYLSDVLPHVLGCPEVTAVNAIRNAAIEFCEHTSCWQETQSIEGVTPDEFPYQIEAPSGARVANLISVAVDGLPVAASTISQLDAEGGGWRLVVSDGTVSYYQPTEGEISLYPVPSSSKDLSLTVAFAPTRKSTGADDRIYQRHLEAIASGALKRLFAVPGQAWSNPILATYHGEQFATAISRAKVDSYKFFSRAGMVMRSRAFG